MSPRPIGLKSPCLFRCVGFRKDEREVIVKAKLVLASVISFLIALGCDTVANAYTFRIDNFKIIKNGNLFFEDTFSDGSPPPSAPNFPNGNPASYIVSRTVGPESGGKLTIDSAGATAVGSITGVGAFVFQQAVLSTSTDSSNLALGLKIDDTFSVTGLFDLVTPGFAASEGYGISLTDRVGASSGNDDLRLEVRRNAAGSVRVAFIHADATANTFTILATAIIETSHQQIALKLSRPTPANNQIVASFAYVDGGVQGPTTTFPTSGSIFRNENFTRARFFTETPFFPTDLRPVPGNQLVDLRWNSFTQGVEGWNVYFRVKSTSPLPWKRVPNFAQPNDAQVPTTNLLSYRVNLNPMNINEKLLVNGVAYEFSVTAVTTSGDESVKSISVTATPRIGNPEGKKPKYPIVFLHGIASTSATWDDTMDFLNQTYGWTLGGLLKTTPYGQLCKDPNSLRLSTFDRPCAEFLGFGIKGDFYAANFFDNNANYNNAVDGIRQQGREVKAFLEEIHKKVGPGPIIIVAHSMGGLAARSYMEALNTTYNNDVARLVTIGTPHKGTPAVDVLANSATLEFLLQHVAQIDIHRDSDGVRDMRVDPLFYSLFLSPLNSKPLPPADYVSIVSLFPPDKCYIFPNDQTLTLFFRNFAFDKVGPSDCLVPVESQNLKNITAGATIVLTNRQHFNDETKDHASIIAALGQSLVITTFSPVDIEVTDPSGARISKILNDIPGATYEEIDFDGDGELNDVVTIPFPLAGNYLIRVIPDGEAAPTETYSLETTLDGVTTILTQNQRLQDIPTQPFVVDAPLLVNIDIKPGDFPNSIQRRSQGRIPVAILSTQTFDATTQVNRLSLTFGHTGDETSLDFCNPGEDVNGDGLPDLVCHFGTQRTDFQPDDVAGILKGQTVDGFSLRGGDSVRILQ
jgi:pimeloyl-ACP methyl ester carboxylesterase